MQYIYIFLFHDILRFKTLTPGPDAEKFMCDSKEISDYLQFLSGGTNQLGEGGGGNTT